MNRHSLRFGKLLLLLPLFALTGCGSYNRLVTLEQNVNKKWADVQSVYQRRADLIPNLVNTVAGAANFEKSTLTEVTNARASVGQVKLDPSKAPTDAAELEKFQQAQGQLSNGVVAASGSDAKTIRSCGRRRRSKICKRSSKEPRTGFRWSEIISTPRCRSTTPPSAAFPTNMLNKMFGFKAAAVLQRRSPAPIKRRK